MAAEIKTEAEQIQEVINKAQDKITKGWRCGETFMPLTEGHIEQLNIDANKDIAKFREACKI